MCTFMKTQKTKLEFHDSRHTKQTETNKRTHVKVCVYIYAHRHEDLIWVTFFIDSHNNKSNQAGCFFPQQRDPLVHRQKSSLSEGKDKQDPKKDMWKLIYIPEKYEIKQGFWQNKYLKKKRRLNIMELPSFYFQNNRHNLIITQISRQQTAVLNQSSCVQSQELPLIHLSNYSLRNQKFEDTKDSPYLS